MLRLIELIKSMDNYLQIDIAQIDNATLALVCICQNPFFHGTLCDNIRQYASEQKLTFTEEDTRTTGYLYVWVFSGTQFNFLNARGEIYYSISVEYNDCFNFLMAKATYSTVEENQSGIKKWGLNECGRLVFNCLLKYTHSFDMYPLIISNIYDKERNSFVVDEDEFIKCMNNTREIFKTCAPFYAGVAGNILKELFKYANPLMTINDVRHGKDMEEAETTATLSDEFTPAHVLTARNEDEYMYDMLEPELNALVLEASISDRTLGPLVNIRRILNMFILILNQVLQGHVICSKSGGEVFRYFGELSAYTNDIDTKIFYSAALPRAEISQFQSIMLEKLIAITIYYRIQDTFN